MRFNLCRMFFCSLLMLAGAVSGLAIDLVHPLFLSWPYGEADRLYYEDMTSDYLEQPWDIQWSASLTPQNLGTLYIKWQGGSGVPT